MIKEQIIKNIKIFLKKIGAAEEKINLSPPVDLKFGDYTTNIALQISKKIKKNPFQIAETIANQLSKIKEIEKIEVIKPGFINFFISKKYFLSLATNLIKTLSNVNKTASFFSQKKERKLKILLEFGQPNTHKSPHIGHLFSYIYGESLARILEFNSNHVWRVNYQGDIGLHVAKCLYILSSQISNIKSKKTLKEKVDLLQSCYQKGAKNYEQDKKAREAIDKLNIEIYEKNSHLFQLWQETRQWSLDFYRQFEKRLGIKYDRYYFESETSITGKKIVLENLGRVFEKSQKAVIFPGERYHLHNRVFINQYSYPTYEAKDIGLITQKMNDFDFNLSIVTTANEQNEYWRVVTKVIELIYPNLVGKLKHIGFGMVNLTTGKMSSRTGNILDPFNLLETVKLSIKETFKIADENLIEKIALASIKYSFLNSDYRKNIIFDLEKSITKEGNSGPYLLYTYVRTQSVIKKSSIRLGEILTVEDSINLEDEELDLLRFFNQFSEVVEKSAKNLTPSLIANYLYSLAKRYNSFYQKHPILKTKESIKRLRLLITFTTGQIIKNGLYLLGIKTVEKM